MPTALAVLVKCPTSNKILPREIEGASGAQAGQNSVGGTLGSVPVPIPTGFMLDPHTHGYGIGMGIRFPCGDPH